MKESRDMTERQHEAHPPAAPRIFREPLGGCRRTATLLGVIVLGAALLTAGLWIAVPGEEVASATQAPAAAGLPTITVYSDPSCKCCLRWVSGLEDAGFRVQHLHDGEMAKRKDIIRMVKGRQPIKGLVLPGMPSGAPGMEPIFGQGEAYTGEAVRPDGTSAPFSVHGVGH